MVNNIIFFIFLAFLSFLLIWIAAFSGSVLEKNLILSESTSGKLGAVFVSVFALLICVLGFALVPIMVRLVTKFFLAYMKPNVDALADSAMTKSWGLFIENMIVNHGWHLVYVFWVIFLLGLIVVFPIFLKDLSAFFIKSGSAAGVIVNGEELPPLSPPSLQHQIDAARNIVLVTTVQGDSSDFFVVDESWKGTDYRLNQKFVQDFGSWKIMYERIFHNKLRAVLFFDKDFRLFDFIPEIDGQFVYGLYALSVQEKLGIEAFKKKVQGTI